MYNGEQLVFEGEPQEPRLSAKDVPALSGDGGIYVGNIAFTRIREGKKDIELAGNEYGKARYIDAVCICKEIKTGKIVGRTQLTLFLNTKTHWQITQLSALCGAFDKKARRSVLTPSLVTPKDKEVEPYWSVPDLESKNFIVALAKVDVFVTKEGKSIDRYDICGFLSESGVNVKHYLTGNFDEKVAREDYVALRERTLANIENNRLMRENQAKASIAGGAGVSVVQASPYGQAAQSGQQVYAGGAQFQQQLQPQIQPQTQPQVQSQVQAQVQPQIQPQPQVQPSVDSGFATDDIPF